MSSSVGLILASCRGWVPRCALAAAVLTVAPWGASAQQRLVPGTGHELTQVGDDFEDAAWSYTFNSPKSSEENDGQQRKPGGFSTNSRWFEGAKRGQPDIVKRVETPLDGLEGSAGALLLRSKQTGVPGRYGGKFQQDDFICNVKARLRTGIPISRQPSVVVRVNMPPWDQWERRHGPSFGIRATCQTHRIKSNKGRFGGASRSREQETYWPGFFVHFVPGNGSQKPDSAYLTLRAGSRGQDIRGPKITEPGWWTFGMSFTPEGRVHYYAHAGVEDLTEDDYITTQNPYSFRCEQMDTLFFNVVSGDNGRWSTPWVVDDAQVFIAR